MKKSINYIGVLLLLLGVVSCAEEELVTISPNPQEPTLVSPTSGTSWTFSEEQTAEMLNFEFTPADYGFRAAVSYTVQMDLMGNNFETPVDVIASTSSPARLTVGDLNQKLLQMGLQPEQSESVEFRLKSSVNPGVEDMFSGMVNMQVVPFAVQLQFPRLYLPGDYQGWNPANENTIIYSENSDNMYEGYIHVLGGNGEFKINEGPNWDVNYGDNGANGTLDQNGDNINVGSVFGTFLLRVNMDEKTYQVGPPRKWGIVGDATPGGWDADTPMEFDADENVLVITTDLSVGLFKFRANNSWDFNYGENDGDGVLQSGGSDIPVAEAGNYTITMDWKVPGVITYTITKN
jgi:hypothetical protein